MQVANYYQDHLDRVSRSFAFCIARLEGDLREQVSLSYLLCRMLDTVEDSSWPSIAAQDQAFDLFRDFVENGADQEKISAWYASFPQNIPEGEKILIKDSLRSFHDLHAMPEKVRIKIQRAVLNMYRGMRFFLQESRVKSGTLRLKSISEVNQYCFFVAGLVGELLTDLVSEGPVALKTNTYLNAHHFGLFLQKINLLKDQAKDEKEGRFLVPSRQEMLASLAYDAQGAIQYLISLPVAEKGYRLFCAWSLFLGLASLPWIERSSLMGILQKIPRIFTEKLLSQVERLIDDNQALTNLFREMISSLPAPIKMNGRYHSIPWFFDLYQGILKDEELGKLGILPLSPA